MSNHEQLSRDLQEIGLLIDAMVSQRDSLREQRDALLEAAKMVLQRWTFNENQWHTHTWHDMADCATVLRAAIAACERNENA